MTEPTYMQARIQYIVEKPPAIDAIDLQDWLNRKACDGWTFLAVDSGNYIFGREGYVLYQLDSQQRLMQVPLGNNS